MTYKTIVIDYAPKTKKMAAAIEKTANEQAQKGWELVTFSITNSAKAILVFRIVDDFQQENVDQDALLQEDSVLTGGDVQ